MVEADRGSLPFALVHGEPLVACAAWALGEAGVTPVDLTTGWADVVAAGVPFVLHDSLCPLTPVAFLHECLSEARSDEVVVVGVRPVTDTVRQQPAEDSGGAGSRGEAAPSPPEAGTGPQQLGDTVEREGLLAVASPLVLPAPLLGRFSDGPGTDLAALVEQLRGEDVPVRLREAPPAGRRVADREDLEVLEALTGPQ